MSRKSYKTHIKTKKMMFAKIPTGGTMHKLSAAACGKSSMDSKLIFWL